VVFGVLTALLWRFRLLTSPTLSKSLYRWIATQLLRTVPDMKSLALRVETLGKVLRRWNARLSAAAAP
jgi:hypothetical protein